MCLFEGKIGWMENFEKKIGRETFLCLVGWGKTKINFGAQIFFPQTHQKVFSPKWRENWEGEAHENTPHLGNLEFTSKSSTCWLPFSLFLKKKKKIILFS